MQPNMLCLVLVCLTNALIPAVFGAEQSEPPPQATVGQVADKAIQFFSRSQAPDGSFSKQVGPGVTAIVVTGIVRHGRGPDDPLVAKGLSYLESFVQPDGGIYAPKSRLQTYETALSIIAFAEANRDGKYDDLLKNAEKFVKGLQIDEGDGKELSDVDYGGVGYGGSGRPDLSNTAFLLDALQSVGNGPDDEAVKRALVFVSRCQNLESAIATDSAAIVNDGGFIYTPAAGGNSPAGETPEGGLRSYGAMTYAGLKSMIFAGVDRDDPRVKAAFKWIQTHYSLDSNPGMGDAGLYYYYHTFAKALDAIGDETIVDSEGNKHDWRSELTAELAGRQREDGSWINQNKRWMESDPNISTAFALLSLSYCRGKE